MQLVIIAIYSITLINIITIIFLLNIYKDLKACNSSLDRVLESFRDTNEILGLHADSLEYTSDTLSRMTEDVKYAAESLDCIASSMADYDSEYYSVLKG